MRSLHRPRKRGNNRYCSISSLLLRCHLITRAERWEYINSSLIFLRSPGPLQLSSPKSSQHIHQSSIQRPIQIILTSGPKTIIKMKLTLALLPCILGMTFASPAPTPAAGVEARQIMTVYLTFYGADNDAQYSISAPADGSLFTIGMHLHLISSGRSSWQLPSSSLTPPLLAFSPSPFPLSTRPFSVAIPLTLPSSYPYLPHTTHTLAFLPIHLTLVPCFPPPASPP